MGFFNKQAAQPQNQPVKDPNQARYDSARSSLLSVVIFSAVNLVIRLLNLNMYFLFSALVPLFLQEVGMAFNEEGMPALMVASIVAAVAIIGIYLVCYLQSKKHSGWLIAALVLFVLDTGFVLFLFDTTMILDAVFHVWVLVSLILGLVAAGKLKKAAAQPPVFYGQPPVGYAVPGVQPEAQPVAQPVAPQQILVNGEPVAQESPADPAE
jgi:hypothetical protein